MTKKNDYEDRLIAKIKQQYEEYRSGGRWKCTKCDCEVLYDSHPKDPKGKIVLRIKCPSCNNFIENFLTDKGSFDTEEFNELFFKYEEWLHRQCCNFHIEDPDDMYADILHRFFVSVMTYNGKDSKFCTYLTNNVKRRFEDFERKNSRVSRANGVQCQLCGRYVGAITRIHLLQNKSKSLPGFPGHSYLHNHIIGEIGKDEFDSWEEPSEKGKFSWEGNDYSVRQRAAIKSVVVNSYRQMFPNADIASPNIYIYDVDPTTGDDYANIIVDKRHPSLMMKGYYASASASEEDSYFVPEGMSMTMTDMFKDYSEKFSEVLHSKYLGYRKRKLFKHTGDKEGLFRFFESILPLVFSGYTADDLATHFNYDKDEVKFWLAKLKSCKEIKLNLNM